MMMLRRLVAFLMLAITLIPAGDAFKSSHRQRSAVSTWLHRWQLQRQQRQQWHGHSHLTAAASLRPTHYSLPQKHEAPGSVSYLNADSPTTAWLLSHSGTVTSQSNAVQGGPEGTAGAGFRADVGVSAPRSGATAAAGANAAAAWEAAGVSAAAAPKASVASWLAQWNNYTQATISCSNSDVTWHVPLGTPWRPKWWPWNYTHAARPQGSGSSSSSGGMNVQMSAAGVARMRRWLISHGKLSGYRSRAGGLGVLSGKKVQASNSVPRPGSLWRKIFSDNDAGVGGVAGQIGAANGDYGVTLWDVTATSTRQCGQCSSLDSNVSIPIFALSDFSLRKQHSPTQTVILVLQNDLQVPAGQGIVFDSLFSCTILTSASTATKPNGYTISYLGEDAPAITINATNNVISLNVSYTTQVTQSSTACKVAPADIYNLPCPVVFVYKAYGVQIGKATVYGRIDIARSFNVRVDYVNGTAPSPVEDFGVVRVFFAGLIANLTQANILITNNDLYGTDIPIVIYGGSSGVGIYNNYLHDFGFAGLAVGALISEVMTATFTDVSQNLVVSKPVTGASDSTGLYWQTHWMAPGNTAKCNYVFGGAHCIYLDNWSSDISISGGACVSTKDGIKINNGKNNSVVDVIFKGCSSYHAWSQCLFWDRVNCLAQQGNYTNQMRLKYYNADVWRQTYPWWSSWCTATTGRNGKPCNPSGGLSAATTANCSALPSDNYVSIVTVDNPKHAKAKFGNIYCDQLPGTAAINKYTSLDLQDGTTAGFKNYYTNDLGVKKTSQIALARKNFQSCPKKYAGPQKFSLNSYFWNFNIPEPAMYAYMTVASRKSIVDQKL